MKQLRRRWRRDVGWEQGLVRPLADGTWRWAGWCGHSDVAATEAEAIAVVRAHYPACEVQTSGYAMLPRAEVHTR